MAGTTERIGLSAGRQVASGTVIWRLPDGQTYVTTPGSALLFPSLCAPTGESPPVKPKPGCANREAMMPTRTRTRAQNRAHRIAAERHHNRTAREPQQSHCEAYAFEP